MALDLSSSLAVTALYSNDTTILLGQLSIFNNYFLLCYLSLLLSIKLASNIAESQGYYI